MVGTASDGEAAWELALELTPDIVLTDIRMPFMDGLELAAKLRELSPRVKTIFLTGYDDFNYAKQALNLQAFDYILKYEDNANFANGRCRRRASAPGTAGGGKVKQKPDADGKSVVCPSV
ncbi:hypothetical protein HMSSN036_02980 [Paenibacillus macerans]|nr:hypothetical protein HMSSN036_02980 [Paenibacillus macerans]